MKWAITQTYLDCEPMVWSFAFMFWEKFGGCYEEWLSEANYIFVESYHEYDSSYGAAFTTMLYFRLSKRMFDRINRPKPIPGMIPDHTEYKPGRIEQILKDLSKEGRFLFDCVINPPQDIKLAMLTPHKRGTDASKLKTCVREYLKDLGWNRKKIKVGFEELKLCLS